MSAAAEGIERAARYAALRPPLLDEIDVELESAVRNDPDPRVRGAGLGALVRAGSDRARTAWNLALGDAVPAVRRRAAELGPSIEPAPIDGLLRLLGDPDPLVAEAGAWALGEVSWTGPTRARVVDALVEATGGHPDPLVRESAVAALGAVGDPGGLPAILAAGTDRPAIRRRVVLALAPFSGPEVDAALERALTDSDWQVRQAAEDLAG